MPDQAIRVAVLAPSYPPAVRGGGPARSIEAAAVLAPQGFAPFVLTPNTDIDATPLPVESDRWVDRNGVPVYYASLGNFGALVKAYRAMRWTRPAIVALNSFFDPRLSILAVLLWRAGFWGRALLLLAPRGEFSPAALTHHGAKKRPYLFLFRTLRLHRKVVWHSTAEHETTQIRAVWGDVRVLQRSNDTRIDPESLPPLVPNDSGGLRVAFLARLVDHKGAHILVEALRSVAAPIELHLYGPHENRRYLADLTAAIGSLSAHHTVVIHDTVEHEDVIPLLATFDVFALPTASENFGHVIAEALAAGCIVAVPPTTPWTDTIANCGRGVVVPDRDVQNWANALASLASLDSQERHAARAQARQCFLDWAQSRPQAHIWEMALS